MSYPILQSQTNVAATMRPTATFAELGSLQVRLAESEAEVRAAQALRYRIFYEELSARPTPVMERERRDFDRFDEICDHLLVVDRSRTGDAAIVGTYRLLRETVAGGASGFYSNQEYDLSPLFRDDFRQTMLADRQLLELGRSCVEEAYRANSTIHLLWRGIATYTLIHNVGYMFGCASLSGTNPRDHAMALSHLYHDYRIPDAYNVRAQPERFNDMDMIPRDQVDVRAARRALPPLVKGYLRLGCFIGDGAVVDEQWGSTDIFILLPVERMTNRYQQHFDLAEFSGAADNAEFAATDPARII